MVEIVLLFKCNFFLQQPLKHMKVHQLKHKVANTKLEPSSGRGCWVRCLDTRVALVQDITVGIQKVNVTVVYLMIV